MQNVVYIFKSTQNCLRVPHSSPLWTELCPSKPFVEALSPKVMVLGDGATGQKLRLNETTRAGPTCDRTGVPLRRGRCTRDLSLSPRAHRKGHVSTQRRQLSASQEERLPRNQPWWHLHLASKLWRNKFLLLKPPGLGYSVTGARAD